MGSRALTTTYLKLFSRMSVRSLCSFSPSYSNIPTNCLDLNWRSKELPHVKAKKYRVFNQFLQEGPAFPQSRYKMGEIATELKNSVYIKHQMTMRKTCDRRRLFMSHTHAVSDATSVESNTFSADVAGNPIIKGPGMLIRMMRALSIKGGKFPSVDNVTDFFRCRDIFYEQKHNIILENYGLYKKGNTDWHVDGVSKLRYMSIENFIWWFYYKIPKERRKYIYNYMFKQRIYVLENCPPTLLEHPPITCFWRRPTNGWYMLNVSGFFRENLGGTNEAGCGAVFRDCRGTVLNLFHKPLPHATSRDEVFLLGVQHGIHEILQRRCDAKRIRLEIDHIKIVKVLRYPPRARREYMEFYRKIFDMMSKFYECRILLQYPQGNSLPKRVAYIASHLIVGQSFPIGDKGYETQVVCDQLRIPQYVIVPKRRVEAEESDELEESSDDDDDGETGF